jgi:oligopeptide/dipeptide ABC transporter ATP-binding protein
MDQALMSILEVEKLSTTFFTDDGVVPAVHEVSFKLAKGETLGIVGESGSGKTVTSKTLMRIIPSPPGKITGGKVLFNGEDLVQASDTRMQEIRGNKIAMIFQEPMSALNPVFKVGWQIDEALRFHQKELNKAQRRKRVLEMLEKVNMPSPRQRINEYPHQLSGGMRQRVMIAMALACNPEILIADEPTTALDVTIQAQVLRLINQLRAELGTAVILITHDLGVVAEVCDRVLVMYAGQVVEEGSVDDIFHRPAHPYTRALLRSIPKRGKRVRGEKFKTIEGMVPNIKKLPPGCRFQGRCDIEHESCRSKPVEMVELGDGRRSRCLFTDEMKNSAEEVNEESK